MVKASGIRARFWLRPRGVSWDAIPETMVEYIVPDFKLKHFLDIFRNFPSFTTPLFVVLHYLWKTSSNHTRLQHTKHTGAGKQQFGGIKQTLREGDRRRALR